MNRDYLIFINITLYKKVISKFISPSVSQYVIVALTRAGIVQSSKYLLEQIITKREFFRKQHENREKMKETDLQNKLTEMQKSTDEQLDDKVAGKIDKTVPRTVMAILSTELTSGAFKKNKKQKKQKFSSSSHMGDNEPASDTLESSAQY